MRRAALIGMIACHDVAPPPSPSASITLYRTADRGNVLELETGEVSSDALNPERAELGYLKLTESGVLIGEQLAPLGQFAQLDEVPFVPPTSSRVSSIAGLPGEGLSGLDGAGCPARLRVAALVEESDQLVGVALEWELGHCHSFAAAVEVDPGPCPTDFHSPIGLEIQRDWTFDRPSDGPYDGQLLDGEAVRVTGFHMFSDVELVGYGGDCAGLAACELIADAPHEVSVQFVKTVPCNNGP